MNTVWIMIGPRHVINCMTNIEVRHGAVPLFLSHPRAHVIELIMIREDRFSHSEVVNWISGLPRLSGSDSKCGLRSLFEASTSCSLEPWTRLQLGQNILVSDCLS